MDTQFCTELTPSGLRRYARKLRKEAKRQRERASRADRKGFAQYLRAQAARNAGAAETAEGMADELERRAFAGLV